MAYDDLYTQTLTGANTNFSSTIQGPVDGYRAFADSVNNGLQRLISNDVYMKAGVDQLPAQTNSYTYLWANLGGAVYNNTVWSYNVGTIVSIAETSSYTSPLYFPILGVPINCVIKGFGCYLKGNVSSALPANMPTISLMRRGFSDSLFTNDLTITDSTADWNEYNTIHIVSSNVLSLSTTNGQEHWLKITGSEDSNATNVYKAYMIIARA
jgi:hypothetical protein